ncbi:hypothetical protein BRADI_1g57322v3 [Brachypodium distachyon]|uniref:Uncharacterized protein n=1 Tax=Brachypodium distachyon TaxID=15368 RepID=A0A0Q3S705_BRADI|nr:hypothetical protein BRADI_1g57322v3 [Brachypodium distachyon]
MADGSDLHVMLEEPGRHVLNFFGDAHQLPNGGIQAVLRTAPRTSGYCAVWFGVFSVVERGMVAVRRKEEPMWSDKSVAAAAAFGVPSSPHGVRATRRSALIGGACAAVLLSAVDRLRQVPKDDRNWSLSP